MATVEERTKGASTGSGAMSKMSYCLSTEHICSENG